MVNLLLRLYKISSQVLYSFHLHDDKPFFIRPHIFSPRAYQHWRLNGIFCNFAGAYLLTQKDVFLDRSHITQLLSYILAGKDVNIRIDLPPPVILKVSCSLLQLQ